MKYELGTWFPLSSSSSFFSSSSIFMGRYSIAWEGIIYFVNFLFWQNLNFFFLQHPTLTYGWHKRKKPAIHPASKPSNRVWKVKTKLLKFGASLKKCISWYLYFFLIVNLLFFLATNERAASRVFCAVNDWKLCSPAFLSISRSR